MKYILNSLFYIAPSQFHLDIIFFFAWFKKEIEYEIFYMNKLQKKRRVFIDIGANEGTHSYFFSKRFQIVHAFEPIKEITESLKNFRRKNITVHNIGLSNEIKNIDLKTPVIEGKEIYGLSSIKNNFKGNFKKRRIPIKILDNYNFKNVDLIKIDVEGNEYEVIQGAIKTIKRYKPNLIVEIEQRHSERNMKEIFDLIIKLGYRGFFLNGNSITNIKYFKYETHQKPYLHLPQSNKYVNNFLFFKK